MRKLWHAHQNGVWVSILFMSHKMEGHGIIVFTQYGEE